MLKEWVHAPWVLLANNLEGTPDSCCPDFTPHHRALVTMHRQRDKGLALVDVTGYSHRGSKRSFSWVFERIPHVWNVGPEGAIGGEYEYIINYQNLHRSSSVFVQHCVPHVGLLIRSRRHGARGVAAMANAGHRRNSIAKGL